jgi:DNA-binding NarL/FixJ family response regulator
VSQGELGVATENVAARARAPRLVVVDDDTKVAEELAGLFADVGYYVTGVAYAAKEGIDLVEQTKPDVVLMDVRMEGMSGTEAAHVLRRQYPEVPVVLLSAYNDGGIVRAAEEAEVAAYLVKGCSAGELLSTVAAVLEQSLRRRAQAQSAQAQSAPAQSAPAQSAPAQSAPAQGGRS